MNNENFSTYFTDINSKLLSSITKQISFLAVNNRKPLAILIRADVAKQMLQYVYAQDIVMQQSQLSLMANTQDCICTVYGLPVYMNLKLTKSPIIVIGEFEWI